MRTTKRYLSVRRSRPNYRVRARLVSHGISTSQPRRRRDPSAEYIRAAKVRDDGHEPLLPRDRRRREERDREGQLPRVQDAVGDLEPLVLEDHAQRARAPILVDAPRRAVHGPLDARRQREAPNRPRRLDDRRGAVVLCPYVERELVAARLRPSRWHPPVTVRVAAPSRHHIGAVAASPRHHRGITAASSRRRRGVVAESSRRRRGAATCRRGVVAASSRRPSRRRRHSGRVRARLPSEVQAQAMRRARQRRRRRLAAPRRRGARSEMGAARLDGQRRRGAPSDARDGQRRGRQSARRSQRVDGREDCKERMRASHASHTSATSRTPGIDSCAAH